MNFNAANLAIVIGGWVLLIALVVLAIVVIRKLIARSQRRDAERAEMLDLMREQNRRGDR
ncbi:hypothetical protein M3G00_07790 [Brevibacterium casei]|uniref:hypothetical protein n=1 Tax=Brevibacterium casei TaxID=33889 RepID=UPI00223C3FC5|nr:hypothetical protein [Brevibacterium casei]MCT1446215.1 hypothetical protein [Brevibacterium casei]MCT2182836.1 hypothetical protein [Brevibacterium casei]